MYDELSSCTFRNVHIILRPRTGDRHPRDTIIRAVSRCNWKFAGPNLRSASLAFGLSRGEPKILRSKLPESPGRSDNLWDLGILAADTRARATGVRASPRFNARIVLPININFTTNVSIINVLLCVYEGDCLRLMFPLYLRVFGFSVLFWVSFYITYFFDRRIIVFEECEISVFSFLSLSKATKICRELNKWKN